MRKLRRSKPFAVFAAFMALAMPITTALPATAALAARPAVVQDEKKPSLPSTDSVVGLGAFEAMLKGLADILPDLIKDGAKGEQSDREAAFKALNALWVAAIGSTIAIPVGGAGIGLACDICLAGADLGAGMLAGGLIGAAVSGVNLATWSVIIFAMTLELNDRYPQEAAAAAPASRGIGGSGGPHAGPYESQMVHILDILTPDSINAIAARWENTPGLKNHERAALGAAKWLQPTIQKLAYMKTHKRLSANSRPAMPLSGWLETVNTLLSPGTAAEERWLTALGLGSMSASMNSSGLTLKLPPALQVAGAPAEVKANVNGFDLKAGGDGGLVPYIRTAVQPGKFNVAFGTASLVKSGADKDKIKVSASVGRNASIGSASVRLKWNGPEKTIGVFNPSLSDALNASVFFRIEGQGIALDKVTFGNLNFSLNLPKELTDIPGIGTVLADFEKGVRTEIGKMMNGMPWANLFQPVKQFSAKSLRADLDKTAFAYGLYEVKKVNTLGVNGGKLQAQVQAVKVKLNPTGITPAQVASAVGTTTERIKRPVVQIPRIGGSDLTIKAGPQDR